MSKFYNPTKAEKELPEFVAEVAGLSTQDLNSRLSQLAKDYEAIEEAKEEDEELSEAKTSAKELGAPYREGKKAVRMKSSHIVALIKEKGGE